MFSVSVIFVICATGALAKFDESLISDEVKSLMDGFHRTCVEHTGVDEGISNRLEKLIKRANDGQFADDKNLKCYTKCILVEAGVMDDATGDIKFDGMRRYFPDDVFDKLKETFSTCIERIDPKSDLCEHTYDLFKCYYNVNEDLYFLA